MTCNLFFVLLTPIDPNGSNAGGCMGAVDIAINRRSFLWRRF